MPAYAKGGGHGGGGGGGHSSGGHSSYHSSRPSYSQSSTLSARRAGRSSSRRSRSSSSSSSYSSSSYSSEKNMRIYPTAAEARENGGLICPATLPKVGSKVDIVGRGTATVTGSHSSLQSLYGTGYSAQPLPPGFDAGYTLDIQYEDGTTDTVSAATDPSNDGATLLVLLGAYGGILALEGLDSGPGFYSTVREEYEEWLEEAALAENDKLRGRLVDDEWSGEYWGGSEESDEGDQAIRVSLRLQADGRITGRGRDGIDGTYKITSGRWVARGDRSIEMRWTERYDEGFTAICKGSLDRKSGKIDARFASSRDVRGSFTLAKKPDIF